MLVEKIITTTEKQELDIIGVTLLSIEEYKQYKDLIPWINGMWWLRSPGYDDMHGACVDGDHVSYSYVDYKLGVRPTLKISNSNLQIGDKFKFADCIFTVISEKYALCDGIIGKSAFREDWRAADANDYEVSDIRRYVNKWFNKERNNILIKGLK